MVTEIKKQQNIFLGKVPDANVRPFPNLKKHTNDNN